MLQRLAEQLPIHRHVDEFDLLCPPSRPRIAIHRAGVKDVDKIYQLIHKYTDFDVAPPSQMRFAIATNRNNIILFCKDREFVGLYAMLMLTPAGLEALLLGEFNGSNPHVAHLATRFEPPAAIYQWLVIAPGLASEGVMHVSRLLQHDCYRGANLYARALSGSGARIARSLGFRLVERSSVSGLYRYVRLSNRRPIPATQTLAHAA